VSLPHWLLAYADDVNLLADNADTINKSTETIIEASNDVGPERNVEKYKLLFAVVLPKCRTKL
jgi:hypothetical protein